MLRGNETVWLTHYCIEFLTVLFFSMALSVSWHPFFFYAFGYIWLFCYV